MADYPNNTDTQGVSSNSYCCRRNCMPDSKCGLGEEGCVTDEDCHTGEHLILRLSASLQQVFSATGMRSGRLVSIWTSAQVLDSFHTVWPDHFCLKDPREGKSGLPYCGPGSICTNTVGRGTPITVLRSSSGRLLLLLLP